MAPPREVVRGLDVNQPVYDVRTMEDLFQKRAVNNPNMVLQTVGTIGLNGPDTRHDGLGGLVAYTSGRRTREIGIRMAIGARRSSLLRMVMR